MAEQVEQCVKTQWITQLVISSHLAGVNRNRNEGSLGQELCGAQHISYSLQVSFILLHRLHTHLFFGEQCFITWCIAGWRQELKVAMASTQQETHPWGKKTWTRHLNSWSITWLILIATLGCPKNVLVLLNLFGVGWEVKWVMACLCWLNIKCFRADTAQKKKGFICHIAQLLYNHCRSATFKVKTVEKHVEQLLQDVVLINIKMYAS